MRHSLALALALAFLIAVVPACSSSGNAAEEHAWEADLEGSVEFEPVDACADHNSQGVQTITTAEGTMGDLGPVSARWTHCPGDDGIYRLGTVTFTDENGDELRGSYDEVTDQFLVDPQSWPIEITGGTGRFADASGTVYLMSFGVDWATDPLGWSGHLEGTITY